MPLGADRIGTRRGQLVASSTLILIGLVGVVVAPGPAVVWAIVLGAGMGTIFPIVLTLPVDVGGRPADVAATAALMLLVGYLLSAIAPLAFGIARDLTGDFGLSLGLLVALGVALVALSAALTPERLHRARSTSDGLTAAGPLTSRPAQPAWRRLPEIRAAVATTRSASASSSPGDREPIRRPVEVDRGDDLAGRIGDRAPRPTRCPRRTPRAPRCSHRAGSPASARAGRRRSPACAA